MALAVGLLLNGLVGASAVLAADVLVGRPYASCERLVSDTNGVRIVAYPELGMLPGAHFFFLATTDGGRTWRQFMHFRHDDPVPCPCANIGSLDGESFWAWMGWELGVTHDGGRTWRVWYPWQTWSEWTCCNHGLITDVAFDSAREGTMTLHALHHPEASPLYTDDGGATWHP